MALTPNAVEEYLSQGRLPPSGSSLILRVLGSKPLDEAALKFRLAVSDGQVKFNSIVAILDSLEDLPRSNDIVEFGDRIWGPDAQGRTNEMIEKAGKAIWVVRNFRNLTRPGPGTPQRGGTATSLPRPPAKRPEVGDPGPSSGLPVKRSLFSSPEKNVPPVVDKSSHLIQDLNPYQNKYTIRARVTRKGELKEWSNSRGQGHVFNVVLEDKSGDIQATAFNDLAQKFHPLFEVGRVFYVSHAQVKAIQNKNFNHTTHNYELSLNQNTVVAECVAATEDVPMISYKFTALADMVNQEDRSKVDVLGVCTAVSELREVKGRASGKQIQKRELTLMDQAQNSITLTLWEAEAAAFDGLNRVVACKMAAVSDFNGKSLSASFGSTLQVDPDLPEASELQAWFEAENVGGRLTQMQNTPHKSGAIDPAQDEFTTFGAINLTFRAQTSQGAANFFNVDCYITHINIDQLTYMACPADNCRSKVAEVGGAFFCKKCNAQTGNFKHCYLMRGHALDVTDHQWFTAFDEVATDIMGLSASDLMALKSGDEQAFYRKIEAIRHGRFLFRVKCTMETYNDEHRLKMVLSQASRADPGSLAHIQRLKRDLGDI